MSATAHTENLADHDATGPEVAPGERLIAGGQLARVGRRGAPSLGGSSAGGPRRDLVRHRDELTPTSESPVVRVRRGRREDLYRCRPRPRKALLRAAASRLVCLTDELAERGLDPPLRDLGPNSRMDTATVTGRRGGVGSTSRAAAETAISRSWVAIGPAAWAYAPAGQRSPKLDEAYHTAIVVVVAAGAGGVGLGAVQATLGRVAAPADALSRTVAAQLDATERGPTAPGPAQDPRLPGRRGGA
jgi:hypothetical protein